MVHVTFLLRMAIYPAREAQIALLIAKKVKISTEYLDFSDVFSKKKTLVLLKITDLNQYTFKIQESQQSLYKPIYSLGPVELKTLKTYIETNFANGFIWLSKSSVRALILFIRKPNSNFHLYVNYQGLNNLIFKN